MHYLPDLERYRRMTTPELRAAFLVQDLFRRGEAVYRLADLDRVLLGGIVPAETALELAPPPDLGTDTLTAARELGILNIGGAGHATVDGTRYEMAPLDVLYVGRGDHAVSLASRDGDAPARYYLVSYPAHTAYPTAHVRRDDAERIVLGDAAKANVRHLYKYVRPGAVESAQLVMGITEVQEGSVWNTMPAHTHARRTEVYLYFDLQGDDVVFHLMGAPDEVRTLVVRGGEAVLSPGWSIHAGAGTGRYTFCWAMGGENQDFGDMQFAAMDALR